MRLLTIIPSSLLVGFSESSAHQGEPQSLFQLQLTAIWYGQLHGAPDNLGVSMSYKINVGIEVPVEVLDAVEFGPVPPASNRAVACEYRKVRRGGVSAVSPLESPSDEGVVAEVLQPEAEA